MIKKNSKEKNTHMHHYYPFENSSHKIEHMLNVYSNHMPSFKDNKTRLLVNQCLQTVACDYAKPLHAVIKN